MPNDNDLIRRLNLSGKRLSKGHRSIAKYISEHYDKAVFMTAAALSQECGVSESTVVRFASAMGYEGYPELREALSGLVRQRLTSEQRFAIVSEMDQGNMPHAVLRNDAQNIRKTIENLSAQEFEDVAQRILKARRIYIMGLRSAAPLAQFMYHYLHQILDEVILVGSHTGDVYEEIARISKDDLLFGISFPRYSARTLECMRFARENGATAVALTDSELSPLKEASDVCLCACTDMASFVDSLAAPLSVINALIVTIGLHRREELHDHFRKLEEIWNAHSVYLDKESN